MFSRPVRGVEIVKERQGTTGARCKWSWAIMFNAILGWYTARRGIRVALELIAPFLCVD